MVILCPLPTTIISGGQTGSDIGGLVGAERVGIATGGMAAQGYMTERGPQPAILRDRFGLTECTQKGYPARTRSNVQNSDATLILSVHPRSGGTVQTAKACREFGRPYIILHPFHEDTPTHAITFLEEYTPTVLNIAGNRESISPGIAARVAYIIKNIFTEKE